MVPVTIPLSAFTTSGGAVAADKLQIQIQQDPTITTPYIALIPASLTEVQLLFAAALAASEQAALNAIVAAHDGIGLPDGTESTLSLCIPTHAGGVAVPSFVDTETANMANIGMRQQRQALGPGRLVMARLMTTTNAASVTLQLLLNGTATGAGVSAALAANVGVDFVLPLSESLYAKGNQIALAITGLTANSDTGIEAAFTEAV